MDHVIQTPEVFRIVSGKNEVLEGLLEPPGGTNGPPWALLEREEGCQGSPPLEVRIGQGKGHGAPFPTPSPSPSPSLPFGAILLGL